MTNNELKGGIEAIARIADALIGGNVRLAPPPPKPRGRTAAMARDAAVGSAGGGPLMPQPGRAPTTRTEVLRGVRAEDWHEPSPIRR